MASPAPKSTKDEDSRRAFRRHSGSLSAQTCRIVRSGTLLDANMAAATGRRILKIDEASVSWIAAREKVGAGFSQKSARNQGNLEPSAIRPNCRRL
jgi:hypothetical protein